MAYSKTNWQNLPNQTTPINNTNLNKIEQGIYDATYLNGVNVGTTASQDYKTNIIHSKNLFSGFKNGAYNSTTGVFDASTSGIASEKIGVQPNSEYCISGFTGAPTIRILHWNNDTFISSSVITTLATGNTITALGNYIAFQTSTNATYSDVQLEKGNAKTSYETYTQSSMQVDNEKFTDTLNVGTNVDSRNRVNFLYQGGNILPKGTIYNLTSGSVLLNFKVPKTNTQYTMKSNLPAGESAVVFFGSGADATVTTAANGVSSTTPRTMTSDANGYVTISFRYLSGANERDLDLYWYTLAEGTTGVDYITPSINVDGEEIYKKWELLGKTTANRTISLPNDFEELFVLVKTNNSDFRKLTFTIPRIALTTTTQYFNTAFIGASTSTYNGARIALSTTTANLDSAYNDGNDVRSNTTTYWYYK